MELTIHIEQITKYCKKKNKAKTRKGRESIDLKMCKRASEKNIGETKNKKLKKELSIDEIKTEIINKIVIEINELLDDQTEGEDSTDSVITLFEDIFQPILDKFK